MQVFARNRKKLAVQGFVLKIVNNQCPELKALLDGPRLDRRVHLAIVVIVIPLENQELRTDQAFTAITKEFSCTGVGLILDEPKGLDEVVLGFRWEGEMTFIRGRAKHLNPMGGGFYQLGLQMVEIVSPGDYRELQSISY